MSSNFYSKLLGQDIDPPSRSISAPPKLDSNTLFAYSVNLTQADSYMQYNDARNDELYEEFYQQFKETMPIPPPLTPQLGPEKKVSANEDGGNQALVNNLVSIISEDDSPTYAPEQFNMMNFQDLSAFTLQSTSFVPFDPFYYNYEFSIYDQARDQGGCRVLQQRLDSRNSKDVQEIYNEILPHFTELMMDPFGNYLCQKLIEVCNGQQLQEILTNISPSLPMIALNTHGTRAVQKFIEVIRQFSELSNQIVEILKPSAVMLINDQNGNHVIQKCLQLLGFPYNQFIYDIEAQFMVEIATHRHGCCVLQRSLDAATSVQRQALVDKIVDNSVTLIQDPFGNYVVQYVLDLNLPPVNSRLAKIFTEKILELSMQKFSSNVIEKCLQQNEPQDQIEMIKHISASQNIPHMLQDQYANYGNFQAVFQRALQLAPPQLQNEILTVTKPHLSGLRNTPFGKKVYSKLIKTYPALQNKGYRNRWQLLRFKTNLFVLFGS